MKRKLMLLLTCLFVGIGLVTAQTQRVTGNVTSEEDGLPVVGASVLVKGTTVGTITDIDANFTLSSVPTSAKVLQVSYIGMQSQEVAIKPSVKVVLKSDAKALDEVLKDYRPLVLSYDVSDETVIKRICGRRICPKCNLVYHVLFSPPKEEGKCEGRKEGK